MKKFFVISVLFILTALFHSCSEKCFCDGDIIGSVVEEGYVLFDTSEGRWYVFCPIPGTIDSFNAYYPIAISKDYKKAKMKVKIKGDIYPYTIKGAPALDGGTYYCIDLIEIVKLE